MKEYTDVFVLGNKIIGKDKRTGHYIKIAESDSEKDDTDIEDYDQVAVNRSKGKVTLTIVSDIMGFILNALGAWLGIEWLFVIGIVIFFGSVIVFVILYFGHSNSNNGNRPINH
jgi:hypothetical protein